MTYKLEAQPMSTCNIFLQCMSKSSLLLIELTQKAGGQVHLFSSLPFAYGSPFSFDFRLVEFVLDF